jgi:replicative DNA helicase
MPIRAIMGNVVDRIDFLTRNKDTLMGVPTGFTMLDRLLGGMQKSDLIILAARPAMGKTSLAINVAQNAAKRYNARVAIFSLEMSNEQLAQRLLSMETGIDSHRLRLGQLHEEEWPILLEAANVLAGTNIFIDDTPAASVNEIRTKCRRLYAEHGLDMVLIDYMQLMSGQGGSGGGRNENRQQEISYISRSLKALARELNVPVIALSQLSRAVESRSDKRPMLSDLRESGSIEQDADVVLFIYRDDYYNEDSEQQNIADVIVAKHRHGSTGTVSLYFRKELTQFRDLEIQRTELDY